MNKSAAGRFLPAMFLALLMVFAMCASCPALAEETPEAPQVSRFILNKSTMTLGKVEGHNNTITLSVYKVAPSTIDPSTVSVTFASSNENVAVVDPATGLVTAVNPGKAIITATTPNGKRARCTITVRSRIAPTKITMSKKSATIYVGSEGDITDLTLSAKITPAIADINAAQNADQIRWRSSKTSVVTVDENGKLTAVKPGTATVYCYLSDGSKKKASTKVTVKGQPVSKVSFEETTVNVDVGIPYTLAPTVEPATAYNKTLKWKSSKTSVATVSSSGVVTGKAPGTATITCTAASGKKASIKVTVGYGSERTDYHFYAIGNSNYVNDPDAQPNGVNDAAMMQKLFNEATYSGRKVATSRLALDANAQGITALLQEMASNADITEDDVTVFYYSGYGKVNGTAEELGALCGVNYNGGSEDIVTIDQVQSYLDQVPGRVVVIVDSHMSGRFIREKSAGAVSQSDLTNINNRIISAFATSTATNYNAKALTGSTVKSKYKIITSTAYNKVGYSASIGEKVHGLFSTYFADGCGWSVVSDRWGLSIKADTDRADKVLTVKELYAYTKKNVAKAAANSNVSQVVQAWPSTDKMAVISFT